MIWTVAFWKGAAERALKTFLQTFGAVLVASVGMDALGSSAGVQDVEWLAVASISALATIASLLTSLGNASFVAGQTPQVTVGPVTTPEDDDELDEPEDVDDPEDYAENAEFTEYDPGLFRVGIPVLGDDPDSYVEGTKRNPQQ